MPSASEKAKAKYQAVLDEAKMNHASHRSNRILTSRHPSTGSCEITNSIPRRSSQSSAESGNGRIRTMIKNMMSPPAF